MSSALLKKLSAVAGILVLLWIVYIYRQVPHSQTPFAKVDTQTQSIILDQGSKKVELAKRGNIWKVVGGSESVFDADENQIKTFLSSLSDVTIEVEISNRADRQADYEVNAESGTRVHLLGDKGTALGEGIFGKQAPDYAHIYFRYPDKASVYLARGLIRRGFGKHRHQLLAQPQAHRSSGDQDSGNIDRK